MADITANTGHMRGSPGVAQRGATPGESMSLGWQWPGGMIALSFINFALKIVTLGIYHFWALTETRKRIWSGVRFNGQSLTYTGTGLELMLGLLFVVLVIFVPAILIIVGVQIAFGPQSAVTVTAIAAVYFIGFCLFGVAIYRAMRYRMSRTSWRGIRGGANANPWPYASTFVWTTLLLPLTLGWFAPMRSVLLQHRLVNNLSFGDRSFRFGGRAGPLYGPFAVRYIGALIAFVPFIYSVASLVPKQIAAREAGLPVIPDNSEIVFLVLSLLFAIVVSLILYAWYSATLINHFSKHTSYDEAQFSANVSASGLIYIAVTNFLLTLAGVLIVGTLVGVFAYALGLFDILAQFNELDYTTRIQLVQVLPAFVILTFAAGAALFGPVKSARSTGYVVDRMALEGTVPLADIEQVAQERMRAGEGLSQAFDVDAM